MAARTRHRLDANQELVGQGLANITSGLFSGYAVSGSFSRSACNIDAGARTAVISMEGNDEESLQGLVLHELTHLVAFGISPTVMPSWYSEGLADTYIETKDYNEYLGIVEDLNLRMLDIVAAAGTQLAVPARRVNLEGSNAKVSDLG